MKDQVGIIGNGMVGSAMKHIFKDALIYDVNIAKANATKEDINEKCKFAFICVPTDGQEDGTYDYKPLEETIKWLDVPYIIIKSTVQPGITYKYGADFKKDISFNPEFLREQTRFKDIENEKRIVIGTHSNSTFDEIRDLYLTVYDHDKVDIIRTTPIIAEFVKLINNSYFASKVTFCNEVEKILKAYNIDYEDFRRVWLLEPRIGKNHTLVTKDGGFSGYCLPKDLRALDRKSVV